MHGNPGKRRVNADEAAATGQSLCAVRRLGTLPRIKGAAAVGQQRAARRGARAV